VSRLWQLTTATLSSPFAHVDPELRLDRLIRTGTMGRADACGGGAETTAHDGTPVEFPLGLEGRRSRLDQGRGDERAEEKKPSEHVKADPEAVGEGDGAGCLYLGVRVDVRTGGRGGDCADCGEADGDLRRCPIASAIWP
jgi:hypothetical protein